MSMGTEHPALDALLRLIAAHIPGAQVALFLRSGDVLELMAGDPALAPAAHHLNAALAEPPAMDPFRAPKVRPASVIGLSRGASALAALPFGAAGTAGCLLLVARSRRCLTPGRLALLADAAVVAARHLEAESDGGGDPDHAPRAAAVLPREALHAMIDSASGAQGGLSILLLDLDRFHAVNEALGAAAADAVLAAVGARIVRLLHPDDRMARIEGDRFVVVAGSAGAEALADRLLAGLSQPVTIGDRHLVVQASIGVVSSPHPRLPAAALLTQAAAALRQAKRDGRNRAVLHAPGLAAAALAESRLELDLAEAPARGQMRLVYQPYVDLGTGRIAGVEALLRWQHPSRGTLAPASFIPMAEATGLILPLGAWALRHALADAASWPPELTVSVNISTLQFHQPQFVGQVAAALAAAGIPPSRLELEITETVLMRDAEETMTQLAALIGMGVRIALDDFGTGYSALAYLARLPHHRIKLDRSFVGDLGNPATTELVAAIIALAQKNGAGVTAEGVERSDQLALVRGLGFTHAQGYATGLPVPDPRVLMAEA